jgi:hypothetical protein
LIVIWPFLIVPRRWARRATELSWLSITMVKPADLIAQ